jgi:hypothetical protein
LDTRRDGRAIVESPGLDREDARHRYDVGIDWGATFAAKVPKNGMTAVTAVFEHGRFSGQEKLVTRYDKVHRKDAAALPSTIRTMANCHARQFPPYLISEMSA